MLTPFDSPIPLPLQGLLDLFASDLKAVKFPDVDLAVLEEAAETVRERALVVARAEAALETARAVLGESQEALLAKGQRALAYARVYAEERGDLAARLDALALPRLPRKSGKPEPQSEEMPLAESAPRRRGRPPKAKASAPLFSEDAAPAAQAAAG